MTSTPGSQTPSPSPVRRACVITHGRRERIAEALAQLERVAEAAGVELWDGASAAARALPDLAVVLGGDGTMLRGLARFLGTRVPVLGVNFGRVGFLTAMAGDELEAGVARAFAGDYVVVELPTLQVDVGADSATAVNDVVALSATRGRMAELEWAIAGETLGRLPCDGVICATPSGSTAYNLSNGGPVLMWGLDAMAITFIAPHSLDARPLVVPRSADLLIRNRTLDVDVSVLVDGHHVADVGRDGELTIRLAAERSLLATLPERTFFRRYRDTFAS